MVFAGTFFLPCLGFLPPAAAQSNSSSSPKSAPVKGGPVKSAPTKSAPPAKGPPAKRKTSASPSSRKKRKPLSPRVRRVRQAFVASASLRPMAQQLLQDRTPSAYAGVEAFARRHPKEDAGALAWLVLASAHTLHHDCAQPLHPPNPPTPPPTQPQ